MTSIRPDGRVEFLFYRPNALEVKVLGSFNKWSADSVVMEPHEIAGSEGWWIATVDMKQGEYRFRYCADGVWYTDYAANGVERSKQVWNSVLVVPEKSPLMKYDATDERFENNNFTDIAKSAAA